MKRYISLVLAAVMLLCLAACGKKEAEPQAELQELKIGITTGSLVQRDVFDNMTSRLEAKGYKLVYVEYSTAREAENALAAGEIDFSCCSDKTSFNEYDSKNPEVLLNLGAAYYYPYGFYLCNFESLADITDGATIAIPDDAQGMARALLLLERLELIELKDGVGLNATLDDVLEGKRTFEITAQSEKTLAPLLKSYEKDIVIMSSQTAVDAGYSVHKTAFAIEEKDSLAAGQYSTLLLIKRDSLVDEKISAVKALFFSPLMYDLIDDYPSDLIVPAFDVSGRSVG